MDVKTNKRLNKSFITLTMLFIAFCVVIMPVQAAQSNAANGVQKPEANFSATPTSGNTPLTVTFTDMSTGEPTKWKWDFGDGKSANIQNPTHTYSKAGKYTVSLKVSNAAGSGMEVKSRYVTVMHP